MVHSFTREALRQIDQRAIEVFHIPILVLMENAGRAVADAARAHLKRAAGAIIICGPGNNGGDGLVAARHLHNAGVTVTILLAADRSHFKDAAAAQLAIVDAMRLPVETVTAGHAEFRDCLVESSPGDLIIDALFGTGLSRPVEGVAAELIHAANRSGHGILAVDIPSGLDCDTGTPAGGADGPVIRAVETISFCGLKMGFAAAREYTGSVVVADIGVPRELLEQVAQAKA